MTVQLAGLPRNLQRRVVQQRYFTVALRLALTSRDLPTILEQARELQNVAAVGRLAVKYAEEHGGDDWQDIAKTASVQSLAACVGASLLLDAAEAIRGGEQARLVFVAATRRTFGLAAPVEASTTVAGQAAAPQQGHLPPPRLSARPHQLFPKGLGARPHQLFPKGRPRVWAARTPLPVVGRSNPTKGQASVDHRIDPTHRRARQKRFGLPRREVQHPRGATSR